MKAEMRNEISYLEFKSYTSTWLPLSRENLQKFSMGKGEEKRGKSWVKEIVLYFLIFLKTYLFVISFI